MRDDRSQMRRKSSTCGIRLQTPDVADARHAEANPVRPRPIVNESRFQGAVEPLGIEFRSVTGNDIATLMTTSKRRISAVVISERRYQTIDVIVGG